MITIVAIDPGASGAIAWIDSDGELNVEKYDGKTEADVAVIVSSISNGAFAFLEQVGANRGKGDRRQGASSMFSFGKNYGFWRGLLVAFQVPFEDVRPQKWLPAMGLRGNSEETQTEKKNRHKALAQQLHPELLVTHKTADAILLCEFGRRLHFERHGAEAC